MPETLKATASSNRLKFELELTKAYQLLFTGEDYAYAARLHTPQSLAVKMTAGLADGTANKDGDGIKMACKAVGIKHTYKDIRSYLNENPR